MNDHDIEALMAYVDGALDAGQRADVEALLARDPEARAMVERFRQAAGLLGSGLDEVLTQPVPARLIEAVRSAPIAAGVVEFRPRRKVPERIQWPRLAAAASLVLGVGLVTGVLLLGDPETPAPVTAGVDPLQEALETLQSGSALQTESGTLVTPVLTVRAADGRPCREFEREASGIASFGIACREADGRWVAQIEVGRLAAPVDAGGDYAPASGEQDPLSAALDRLEAGAALPAAEEQRLLASDWRD
jgi:hypothetical protein